MKIKPIIILGACLLFCLLQNPTFAQGTNKNELPKIINGTVLNAKDNSPLSNVSVCHLPFSILLCYPLAFLKPFYH